MVRLKEEHKRDMQREEHPLKIAEVAKQRL